MKKIERILFLNEILLSEMPQYKEEAADFPKNIESQRRLLRSLMNVRPAGELSSDFLREQDKLLQEEIREKGIVYAADLPSVFEEFNFADSSQKNSFDKMILWQGDITRLAVDGIVNAANSELLGCFVPCHACIDNAIHSAAGLQLRNACYDLMKRQGHYEPTGKAKITSAFNLPANYVLHTVGPIIPIESTPTENDAALLSSCYSSCLELAKKNNLKSLAFCCISTGEFHYPGEQAANIAVDTVYSWLKTTDYEMTVVFNVFKDKDAEFYRKIFKNKSPSKMTV